MKKLLILTLILGLASSANAWLIKLSVNGQIDPEETTITLMPSDHAVIDIHVTDNSNWPSGGKGILLFVSGLGTLDMDNATYLWENSAIGNLTKPEPYDTYKAYLESLGYVAITDIGQGTITDSSEPFTIPDGLVIDGLDFHCTVTDQLPNDVTLYLLDIDTLGVLDTQVIHQIPEPATMLLLGLGGLLLRRRK